VHDLLENFELLIENSACAGQEDTIFNVYPL